LHIINFNNLYFRVENETTLICAKNRVDLSSISEVRSYISEWPRFFGPPCICTQAGLCQKQANVMCTRYGQTDISSRICNIMLTVRGVLSNRNFANLTSSPIKTVQARITKYSL